MKRSFLFLACAMLVFASCKKNGSSPGGANTISATVDGKNETFNTDALATKINVSGAYVVSVAGFKGTAGSSDELAITVDGSNPVTTGTYVFPTGTPTDNLPDMAYVEAGGNQYTVDVSGANALTVAITSISDTNVQGTFSGTIILFSGTGAATKTIANGKFNVNFR